MPIKILSPQLSNQIAAGEVVERPASVVKELIENSLDAGATDIIIDIERGGAQRICIRDNGSGIAKDELALALMRHATSKIHDLDDLENILSLGFRGEALASISSVSRLTLTSRPADQNEAWQVHVEGRDMEAIIQPAAHPVGTTIDIKNLFFNTPARRKFLRADKTELSHIDEVVRRIALAKPQVAITLNHNGKTLRQYRQVTTQAQKLKRLALICGNQFVENCIEISWQHEDLSLHGWVGLPQFNRTVNDLNYSYINGRMMRDKTILHAIRQAYSEYIPADRFPAFVLFVDLNPHYVDVNVHPAKHEVRFQQPRLIHDFIYQGVLNALQSSAKTDLLTTQHKPYTSDDSATPISQNISENSTNGYQNRQAAGQNIFASDCQQPYNDIKSGTTKSITPLNSNSFTGDESSNKFKQEKERSTSPSTDYSFSNRSSSSGSSGYTARYNPKREQVSQARQDSYYHFLKSQQQAETPELANTPQIIDSDGITSFNNIKAERTVNDTSITLNSSANYLQPLAFLTDKKLVIAQKNRKLYGVYTEDLQKLRIHLECKSDEIPQRALLVPLVLHLEKNEYENWSVQKCFFEEIGFAINEYAQANKWRLTINKQPLFSLHQNLQHCLMHLLKEPSSTKDIFIKHISQLINYEEITSMSQVLTLLASIEQCDRGEQALSTILQFISLEKLTPLFSSSFAR